MYREKLLVVLSEQCCQFWSDWVARLRLIDERNNPLQHCQLADEAVIRDAIRETSCVPLGWETACVYVCACVCECRMTHVCVSGRIGGWGSIIIIG